MATGRKRVPSQVTMGSVAAPMGAFSKTKRTSKRGPW